MAATETGNAGSAGSARESPDRLWTAAQDDSGFLGRVERISADLRVVIDAARKETEQQISELVERAEDYKFVEELRKELGQEHTLRGTISKFQQKKEELATDQEQTQSHLTAIDGELKYVHSQIQVYMEMTQQRGYTMQRLMAAKDALKVAQSDLHSTQQSLQEMLDKEQLSRMKCEQDEIALANEILGHANATIALWRGYTTFANQIIDTTAQFQELSHLTERLEEFKRSHSDKQIVDASIPSGSNRISINESEYSPAEAIRHISASLSVLRAHTDQLKGDLSQIQTTLLSTRERQIQSQLENIRSTLAKLQPDHRCDELERDLRRQQQLFDQSRKQKEEENALLQTQVSQFVPSLQTELNSLQMQIVYHRNTYDTNQTRISEMSATLAELRAKAQAAQGEVASAAQLHSQYMTEFNRVASDVEGALADAPDDGWECYLEPINHPESDFDL